MTDALTHNNTQLSLYQDSRNKPREYVLKVFTKDIGWRDCLWSSDLDYLKKKGEDWDSLTPACQKYSYGIHPRP